MCANTARPFALIDRAGGRELVVFAAVYTIEPLCRRPAGRELTETTNDNRSCPYNMLVRFLIFDFRRFSIDRQPHSRPVVDATARVLMRWVRPAAKVDPRCNFWPIPPDEFRPVFRQLRDRFNATRKSPTVHFSCILLEANMCH